MPETNGAPAKPVTSGSGMWIAVVVVFVAAACWFAYRAFVTQGFQWKKFVDSFATLDWGWLLLSVILSFSTYVGRAFRWAVLIRPQKPHASLWNLFTATVIGFTALVLFGRPGEMVRPYLIAVKEKLSFSSQMAAWLLERVFDLMMALFIFSFALSRVQNSGVDVGDKLNWVLKLGGYFIGVIGLSCVAVFVALRQFGDRSERRIREAAAVLPEQYQQWFANTIAAFRAGVESTKDWKAVAALWIYSILEWVLITGCSYCLFKAAPATHAFSLTDVLIFLGFAAFGAVIQIPGVGGGLQIVTIVVLTELFGVSLEAASGLALVSWIITFVIILPFGFAFAFHDGLQWRKLRHLGEDQVTP